ncbi:hypothetical protein [Crystallibacter degradans]|uniref:hypothetical protein n=1 Tax=Crystallibacter degradans TaxID=2726743 RepID=UPI001472A133|nr:hypothetical protein [Arthrobacter sp. SF27]NMR30915.1 hypothetical protein [Arthrobacter sp. SF27]
MRLVIVLGVGIFFAAPLLQPTAVVTTDDVLLSCSCFRKRIPLRDIASVDPSSFPTLGYGYRILGKNHRGFIAGGPQVRILLDSGKQYEVSVESVEDFISAISAAMNGNGRR